MKRIQIDSGITLIALVITIIVLLILAGISIVTLTGENGILKRAQVAREEYHKSQIKEELQLIILELQNEIIPKKGDATLKDLKEKLSTKGLILHLYKGEDRLPENSTENPTTGQVHYKGYQFIINDELEIIEMTRVEEDNVPIDPNQSEWDRITGGAPLDQIVDNNEMLEEILNSEGATSHMIATDEIRDAMTNSTNAMTAIGNNQQAMDQIVNNPGWCDQILSSESAVSALDATDPERVPVMTSNTAPEGEVIYSSFHPNHLPYVVFTRPTSHNYDWEPANTNGLPGYIGYRFEQPIWIYKVRIWNGNNSASKRIVLQKSNDGQNWEDVFTDFTYVNELQESIDVINSSNNVGRALYWRIYITEGRNSNYVDITALDFFGK